MNERKEQMGFYLVLPSTSSNEIFSENHAVKLTVMITKGNLFGCRISLGMALLELLWPKQDFLSVSENLWYELQEPKRNTSCERTQVPTSLFYSVSSLLDYVL